MLAGCVNAPTPEPKPTASSVPTPLAFPKIMARGTVDATCATLDDALADWTLAPTLSPGPGTPAAAAARVGGIGCVFTDASAHRLLVGAAKVTPDSVSALETFFTRNCAVAASEIGDHAYYEKATGDAELFGDTYRISVVSDAIGSESDAAALVRSVSSTLGA